MLDTPQADSVRDAEDGVAGSNVSNSPDLLPANIKIENIFLEPSVYSFGWKWFILKEFLTAGDDGRMGFSRSSSTRKFPGAGVLERQLSCIIKAESDASIKGAVGL